MSYINDRHLAELQASDIGCDIAALNFCSFDGTDETELDEIFTQLIEEPNHNNNGTLSGKSQNDLANVIRGGGWMFEEWLGVCIKPDNPRTNAEGKVIKYESPRGLGNQQLFIPKISVRAGLAIAIKHDLEQEYRAHIESLSLGSDLEAEDTGFWEWFLTTDTPIAITEGCKKSAALISAGYPAIALNGVWGWGTNNKDIFGEVERDDRGKSLKTIHPDLEPFLDGRELILAIDRDINPDTVKMVEAAKAALVRAVADDEITITELKWRSPKGIDDYIASRGVKALDKLYSNRKNELRELVNVDDRGWVLLATFMLFCFVPNQTYPVLIISAIRGSGKTAAAKVIKSLIDPGKAPLIKLQSETLKLAVSATRRLVLVYDNVGSITPEQSDDLCRVATGFGHSTKTLFTTDEETNFEFTRPQIITAIDALVTRDDLADRALMIQLGEIGEDKRLPQSELDAKLEAASPKILGALLTALSKTLAELPNVKTDRLPRMADFAKFAIASKKALGLKEGAFLKIFGDSREESRQIVVESSPIGEGIIALMRDRLNWTGTATELMQQLEDDRHIDESVIRSRFYPKTPSLFKRQLKRLIPDLSSLGVSVSEIRQGHESKKVIYLEKVVKTSPVSTEGIESEVIDCDDF